MFPALFIVSTFPLVSAYHRPHNRHFLALALKAFKQIFGMCGFFLCSLNADRTSASWLNVDFAKSQEMLYRNFKLQQEDSWWPQNRALIDGQDRLLYINVLCPP